MNKDTGAFPASSEKVMQYSAGAEKGELSFLLAPALGAALRKWNVAVSNM